MTQGAVKDTTGYVNYVYNISARGTTQFASQLMGLSGMATNVLGQLAFQTSSYLSATEGALLSMGVVASAGFIKATQHAMEFDQALSTVGAISGKTRDEVSGLGEQAMAMSNKFGVATSEMTKGLESLARAGVSTNNMFGILEEAMGLSKLEGLSLDTAINSLISTTNLLDTQNLDLSSPEYAEAVAYQNQKITATSEAAPINATDIIHTLEHVGGYASSTNLDQDDLYAVIAQLGSKGTKSEMAGTSLRAFLAAGQKDTAQRALKRIGLDVSDLWKDDETILSISDMKDVLDEAMEAKGYTQQEKLEFYSDFAGYKQANQIMKIDTSSVREFKEKIDHSWDMGRKINQVIGTAETHVQGLIQAGTNLLTKVGEPFLPIISTIAWTLKTGIDMINMIPGSNLIIAGGLILASVKAISTIFNKIVPLIITAKGDMGSISEIFTNIRDDLQESFTILKNIHNIDWMQKKTKQNEAHRITEQDKFEFWISKGKDPQSYVDIIKLERSNKYRKLFKNGNPYVDWKKAEINNDVGDRRNKRQKQENPPKEKKETTDNRKKNKESTKSYGLIQAVNDASIAQTSITGTIAGKVDDIYGVLQSGVLTQPQQVQTKIPDVKITSDDIKIDDSIIKDLKNNVFKVEVINVSRIVPVHDVGEKKWNKQKKADNEVRDFLRRGVVEVHDNLINSKGREIYGQAMYDDKKMRIRKDRVNTDTEYHELGHVLNEPNVKGYGKKISNEERRKLKNTHLRDFDTFDRVRSEYEANLYAVKLAEKRGEKVPKERKKKMELERNVLDRNLMLSSNREEYIDDLVNATIVNDNLIRNKFEERKIIKSANTESNKKNTPKVMQNFLDNFVQHGKFLSIPKEDYNEREFVDIEKMPTYFVDDNRQVIDYNAGKYIVKVLGDFDHNIEEGKKHHGSFAENADSKMGMPVHLLFYEKIGRELLGDNVQPGANIDQEALSQYESLLFALKLMEKMEVSKEGNQIPSFVQSRLKELRKAAGNRTVARIAKDRILHESGPLKGTVRAERGDKYWDTVQGDIEPDVRENLINQAVEVVIPYFNDLEKIFSGHVIKGDYVSENKVIEDKENGQTVTISNLDVAANSNIGINKNLGNKLKKRIKEWRVMDAEGVLPEKDNEAMLYILKEYGKQDREKTSTIVNSIIDSLGDDIAILYEQFLEFQRGDVLSIPHDQLAKISFERTGSESIDTLQIFSEQLFAETEENLNLKTYSTDFKGTIKNKQEAMEKEIGIINKIIKNATIPLQKTNPMETQDMINIGDPMNNTNILSRATMKVLSDNFDLDLDFDKSADILRNQILEIFPEQTQQAQIMEDVMSVKDSSLMKSFEEMIDNTSLDKKGFENLLIKHINNEHLNYNLSNLKGVFYQKKDPSKLYSSNSLYGLTYALLERMKNDEENVVSFLEKFKDTVDEYLSTGGRTREIIYEAMSTNMSELDYVEGMLLNADFDPDTSDMDDFIEQINDDRDYFDPFLRDQEPIDYIDVNGYEVPDFDPNIGNLTDEEAAKIIEKRQKRIPADPFGDTQTEKYNPYHRIKFGYNLTNAGQESIFNRQTYEYQLTQAKEKIRPHIEELARLHHESYNMAQFDVAKEVGLIDRISPYSISSIIGPAHILAEAKVLNRENTGKNFKLSDTDSLVEATKIAKYNAMKKPRGDAHIGRIIGTEENNKKDPYIEDLEKASLHRIWTTSLSLGVKAGIPENSIKSSIAPAFDIDNIPYVYTRRSVGKNKSGNVAYGRTPTAGIFSEFKDPQDHSTHHAARDDKKTFSWIDFQELRLKRLVETDVRNTAKAQGMLATNDPLYNLEKYKKNIPADKKPILTPHNINKIAREQLTPTMESYVKYMYDSLQFTNLKDLKDQVGEEDFSEVTKYIKDRMNTMGTTGSDTINMFKTWVTEEELGELKKQNLIELDDKGKPLIEKNKKGEEETKIDEITDEDGNVKTVKKFLVFDWGALQRTKDEVAQSFTTSMISRSMLATEEMVKMKAMDPSAFAKINETISLLPETILKDPTSLLKIDAGSAINFAGTTTAGLFDIISALEKLEKLNPDEIEEYTQNIKKTLVADPDILKGFQELGYDFKFDEVTNEIVAVTNASDELIPTFELLHTILKNIATQAKMIYEMNQIFDPEQTIADTIEKRTINQMASDNLERKIQIGSDGKTRNSPGRGVSYISHESHMSDRERTDVANFQSEKRALLKNIEKNEDAIFNIRSIKTTSDFTKKNMAQNKHKYDVVSGTNFLQPITNRTIQNLPPDWVKMPNDIIDKKPYDFDRPTPSSGVTITSPIVSQNLEIERILNNKKNKNTSLDWNFVSDNLADPISVGGVGGYGMNDVVPGAKEDKGKVAPTRKTHKLYSKENPMYTPTDISNRFLNKVTESPLATKYGWMATLDMNNPKAQQLIKTVFGDGDYGPSATVLLREHEDFEKRMNAGKNRKKSSTKKSEESEKSEEPEEPEEKNIPQAIPNNFGMPGFVTGPNLADAGYYSHTRGLSYLKAKNTFSNVRQHLSSVASPYADMVYNKFGEKDNSETIKSLDNLSVELGDTTNILKGFSDYLQEASNNFPPLIGAVIALDTVIGTVNMAKGGIDGLQNILNIGKQIKSNEGLTLFADTFLEKTLTSDSNMGKMFISASNMVGTSLEKLSMIFWDFITPIAIITAGLIAIKGALDWSYQSHKKYLESLEEEQKGKRSKSRGLQLTNENLQKEARENRAPRQQDRLDRNAQLAQTQLDNANMSRSYGAIEITRQRNDTLWGDYGISAGLGKLSGNYESTAAEYDGTTGQIRRIKEATLANPFSSGAMNQVSSYYDANQLAFGVMDEYKDELGKLYDAETSAMLKYHSDDVRGSPEFNKALDDFVEATGITRDHAQQYLDYMQTEHEVDKATQTMQAQADQIAASTELKVQAIAFGGNPADVLGLNGIEAQQDAMIKAQADMVKMELSGQLWWKAVWSTITTPVKLILSPLFIITDLLGAIWSFITGNWGDAFDKAGRAGSRLNVFGEAATYWGAWADTEATDFNAIGQGATDSYNRANYGNVEQPASGGYHPTHYLDANADSDRREYKGGAGGYYQPPSNGGYVDHRESQTHYINANRGSYHFLNKQQPQGKEPTAQLNPLSSIGTMLSTIISILTTGLLVGGGIYGLAKLIKSDFSIKALGEGLLSTIKGEGTNLLDGIFAEGTIAGKIKDVVSDPIKSIFGNIKGSFGTRKDQISGFLGRNFNIGGIKEEAEWYRHGELDNASPLAKIYGKGLNYMEENPDSAFTKWISYPGEKAQQLKDMALKGLVGNYTPVQEQREKVINELPTNLDTDEITDEQVDALAEKYNIDTSNVSTSFGKRTLVGGELKRTGKWDEAIGGLHDDMMLDHARENGLINTAKTTIGEDYINPWREYLTTKSKEKQQNVKNKIKDHIGAIQEEGEWYRNGQISDEDVSTSAKIYAKGMDLKEKVFGKAENTNFSALLQNPKEFLSDPRNIEGMGKDIYKTQKKRFFESDFYKNTRAEAETYRKDPETGDGASIQAKLMGKALNWKDKYLQGDSVQEVLKDPERTVGILQGTIGDIQGGALDDLNISDEVREKVSGLFTQIKEGAEEGIDEEEGGGKGGLFASMKKKLAGWYDGGEEEYDWYKDADAISFGDLSVKNKGKAIKDKVKDSVMGSRLFDWYREEPDEEYDWYQNADAMEFGDLSGKNQLRAILDSKGEALKENGLSSLNMDFGIGEHIQGKINKKTDSVKNKLSETVKSSVSNIKGKLHKEYKYCPQCGHKNEPDAEYCEECGFMLNEETIEKGKKNALDKRKTQGSMLTQMHSAENIPQHAAQPNFKSNALNTQKVQGSMLTNMHTKEGLNQSEKLQNVYGFCERCGGIISEEDEFCPTCGARVKDAEAYCPVCNAGVSLDDEFCLACGAELKPKSKTQKMKSALAGVLHGFEDKINGTDTKTKKTSSVQHKVDKTINTIQNKMAGTDTETVADKDEDSIKNRHKRGEWSKGMLDHDSVNSKPLSNMKMTTVSEDVNEPPISRISKFLEKPEYPKYYNPNLVGKVETPGAMGDAPSVMNITENEDIVGAGKRILGGEDPMDVAKDTLKDRLTGGESGVKGINNALKNGGNMAQKASGFLKGKSGTAGKVGNVLNKAGSGATKAGTKGIGGMAKTGLGKLGKTGVGKAVSGIGGKVVGGIGKKLATKGLAQVGSKVLGGALMATGIGAPLGLLLESPIGGMLMEGAMDLGGKALGAVGGAIGGVGNAIGGLLGFGKKTHYQQAGGGSGGGPGLLKHIAPGGGMLGAMAGGGIAGLMGMGVGLLGSIFKNNKDHKNKSNGIGDIAQRILKNVVDGNKKKPASSSGGNITIQNININTADDPEAIKAMFLELLIELQEQVNPRLVSRTVGEPPATSSTDTNTPAQDAQDQQNTNDPNNPNADPNSTTNTTNNNNNNNS